MTRKGLWIAAIVVIVSNAFTLWAARANRAGEPEAVLELTERELRLPGTREADNTAMALRLEWTDLEPAWRGPGPSRCRPGSTRRNWRPSGSTRACRSPARTPSATAAWRRGRCTPCSRTTARRGAATSTACRAGRRRTRPSARRASCSSTSAPMPAALRARHPDRRRTVIVPATAGLSFVQPRSGEPFLKGRINIVYPVELNVPKELRPALESLAPRSMTAPARPGERRRLRRERPGPGRRASLPRHGQMGPLARAVDRGGGADQVAAAGSGS